MPQGLPTPPLVGGKAQTLVTDPILQSYVFQSGIHKPEHSNLLSYKYPQYYLTSMLDRLGPSEPLGADVWSWNVMDRTRRGDAVGALDSGTGWVDYIYTKPDKSGLYQKTTYYKLITASNGEQYIVCSGRYK